MAQHNVQTYTLYNLKATLVPVLTGSAIPPRFTMDSVLWEVPGSRKQEARLKGKMPH